MRTFPKVYYNGTVYYLPLPGQSFDRTVSRFQGFASRVNHVNRAGLLIII